MNENKATTCTWCGQRPEEDVKEECLRGLVEALDDMGVEYTIEPA
ncbi:hypothetical protein [Mycobacteroides abscessus]|nr:hypothetical protein [Mycobacteroides abscessus]